MPHDTKSGRYPKAADFPEPVYGVFDLWGRRINIDPRLVFCVPAEWAARVEREGAGWIPEDKMEWWTSPGGRSPGRVPFVHAVEGWLPFRVKVEVVGWVLPSGREVDSLELFMDPEL